MHPTNCLNCGTILTADDHFCPFCGQRTDTHRLTIKHIIHEFFHSFTHADKGFLGMVADLAIKPGLVAKEYVRGKRKKYFSPFTFFLLSIGILVFSSHFFKTLEEHKKVDERVLAQMPNEAAKKSYVRLVNRLNNTTDFVNKNMNTITMLVLPFYAFLFWIFFGRRGYNYSEMLVACMLFQSFVSLLMAIFIVPWITKFKDQPFFYYAYGAFMLLTALYVGIAQYHFLELKKRWMVLLTTFVSLLGYILVFAIMILSMIYYLFGSKTGEVLTVFWTKYIG